MKLNNLNTDWTKLVLKDADCNMWSGVGVHRVSDLIQWQVVQMLLKQENE